jgi:cell division protein FtsZ
MEFNLPKEQSSILKVIGVGGGGSNAVNHMFLQGIKGVDFVVCNTDQQALDNSPVPIRVQIGTSLTEGRGAGSQPEVGKNAAIESIDELVSILQSNTAMVFITAGMGGGTGTGAAPVIAKAAKEMGILTVGIVTIPFSFEGPLRKKQAEQGLEQMRQSVDTLLVIKNDKLREHCGNLSVTTAFQESDNVLTTAAKGIAEVISTIGLVNVDLNDVKTVMKDSGAAIMGSASASGENRAAKAVTDALESPLLNDNDIRGARHVLLNITFGANELTMDEMDEITNYIQSASGGTAEVIMGYGQDEALGEHINVTVIATGFQGGDKPDTGIQAQKPEKKYIDLDDDSIPTIVTPPFEGTPIEEPLTSPTQEFDLTDMSDSTEREFEEPYLKTNDEDMDMVDNPLQHDLGFSFDDITAKNSGQPTPSAGTESEPKKKYFVLGEDEDESTGKTMTTEIPTDFADENTAIEERITVDDHQRLTQERLQRVQEHSLRLRTPSGLSDLEKEPAYKRRKLKLADVPHSAESQMSRYTLTDTDIEGIELKKNNPYLDKNVD